MLEEERTSWHTLDTAELLDRQASHPRSGLPAAEADARLARYGPNELIDRGGRTLWQILLEQVASVMIIIVLAAMETEKALRRAHGARRPEPGKPHASPAAEGRP